MGIWDGMWLLYRLYCEGKGTVEFLFLEIMRNVLHQREMHSQFKFVVTGIQYPAERKILSRYR